MANKCPSCGQIDDFLASTPVDKVIETVAELYSITPGAITGPSRLKRIAEARHLAMHLARVLLRMSFQEIGDAFGGRDHSTVVYGDQKMRSRAKNESRMRKLVADASKAIREAAK